MPITTARVPPASQSPVIGLLELADTLENASPSARRQAVEVLRENVHETPSALSYARLSVALGIPRQRLYTPDEAARYARLALTTEPNDWDPASRRFLEDRSRLLDQISGRLARARAAPASRRRIAELEEQLAAARAKISALTNIENELAHDEARP